MGPLGSAAAWPVALWAQQPAIPVISYLSGRSASVEASTLAAELPKGPRSGLLGGILG